MNCKLRPYDISHKITFYMSCIKSLINHYIGEGKINIITSDDVVFRSKISQSNNNYYFDYEYEE